MPSILFLPVIFVSYTLGLYFLAVYLSGETDFLNFPTSIDGLSEFSKKLSEFQNHHPTYVFVLFCLTYIWKQSFAIPGSFILNLLAGSLYGLWLGLPLACLLTAIGATHCYLLSKYFAKDYVVYYFRDKIDAIASKLNDTEVCSLTCLISFRLMPMTPNWLLNILSPIVGIPIHSFFISVLIGLIPYNLVCVQSGTMLADIHSRSDVIDATTILKLFLVALLLLLPKLVKRIVKWFRTEKVD